MPNPPLVTRTSRPAPTRQAAPQKPRTAVPGAGNAARQAGNRAKVTGTAMRVNLGRVFESETSDYYLLFGTSMFLLLIGLVMVLSASSVDSWLASGDFFGGFSRQLLFAVIGIPLMLLASRMPLVFWKKWAKFFLYLGGALQLLVFTPLGYETGGNRNWINIGGFTAQPSELIKIALAVWLGVILPISMNRNGHTWRVITPLVPGLAIIALVLLGGDMGTVIILSMIVFAGMFFAGLSWRVLMIPIVFAIGGFLLLTITSPNRMARFTSFLGASCTDYTNLCWQPLHGTWALANGGIFGVGLGNSKAKWSWLPAADNDYIFAIIGEELGLIGCIVVLGLFVLLAVTFLRIIRNAKDPMVRITTGAVMVWIIGQGFINIGVVLGVLPVLGVPLPLLSAGGTSLVATLIAIGVVLSFTREAAGKKMHVSKKERTAANGARRL